MGPRIVGPLGPPRGDLAELGPQGPLPHCLFFYLPPDFLLAFLFGGGSLQGMVLFTGLSGHCFVSGFFHAFVEQVSINIFGCMVWTLLCHLFQEYSFHLPLILYSIVLLACHLSF